MKSDMLYQTVAELVSERPARSRVFERYGVDFCCGGKRSLIEVCGKKGLRAEEILEELRREDAGMPRSSGPGLMDMPLAALIEDIESTHHAYLRAELPRIAAMLDRVACVHGDKDERLPEMTRIFDRFARELFQHMDKEEHILFPAIQTLALEDSATEFCFASVAFPIAQMEAEHSDADNALRKLGILSDGFTPPDYACNTWRAMLDALRELETDMHLHVHKENHVLFPRAITLEQTQGTSK